MSSSNTWGLHWFRRDLRLAGNETLRANWHRHQGRTLGVFFFDSTFLSRADFSHNRFGFFLKTLGSLRAELRSQGGDLLVIDSPPLEGWPRLLDFLAKAPGGLPSLISWGRDYEPFARARDQAAAALFATRGIETLEHRDHLLFEPAEVLKDDGSFYQVYSPFARRWFGRLEEESGRARVQAQSVASNYFDRLANGRQERIFAADWNPLLKLAGFPFNDAFDEFSRENSRQLTVPLPEAGFAAAYSKLREFKQLVARYKADRDFPALSATSRLSIYLKNGSLVSSQILAELGLAATTWKDTGGPAHFVKEVAWREFYYSILFHRPDVEHQSFLPQYRAIEWENDEALFERWKEGTTGFPIVDAGMRELRQTGWMHNRVRMIVASFLTKDLLIDWRWGENHFMRLLLDGDLAPNNGGWQWAASTGCDPQPYFRIFNPWLQSAKFDPDGTYIKRYVPELAEVPAKALHTADADRSRAGYPRPVVLHEERRGQALELYHRTLGKAPQASR